MKRKPHASRGDASRGAGLAALRARLAEAEDTLHAIRRGEVDAVVVAGRRGARVFTLEGAGHAYRSLVESMNEGALALSADKTILYSNDCFARMVKCPLDRLIGGNFRRFLPAADRARLRPLMRRAEPGGSKILVHLRSADGTVVPAQISIRRLATNGPDRATVGMVVTDISEARRTEERLRELTQRVVQAQDAERSRLAGELHDHITQLLCAALFQSQALSDRLAGRDARASREATRLREMLCRTADEVERISRRLRPGILDQLGLAAVVRSTGREFAERTGLRVRLDCREPATRPAPDVELALLRILQEALTNVEEHARAGRVGVRLSQRGTLLRMSVRDDGAGFDVERPVRGGREKTGLGLVGMGERARSVGGVLSVESAAGRGTKIVVEVPLGDERRSAASGPAAAAGREAAADRAGLVDAGHADPAPPRRRDAAFRERRPARP